MSIRNAKFDLTVGFEAVATTSASTLSGGGTTASGYDQPDFYDNAAIANRFHSWNQALLQTRDVAELPRAVADGLKTSFHVPQATLRLFSVAPQYANEWFATGATEDSQLFANSLMAPYCGGNNDFEAARWLDDAANIKSVVILPLRKPGVNGAAFGLLVMGSPDPERFTSLMATDFLVHIGETASVALAQLQG